MKSPFTAPTTFSFRPMIDRQSFFWVLFFALLFSCLPSLAATMGITHEHPLASENQILLESLQKECQVIGYHGEQLQRAQFWTMGFVVYRCDDYTDNALWERYMQMLWDEGERYFVKLKMDRTVASYWDWTVVEDRESLRGADKNVVKQKHEEWRDARSEERDGPGALHMVTRWMPRFMFALHVCATCWA